MKRLIFILLLLPAIVLQAQRTPRKQARQLPGKVKSNCNDRKCPSTKVLNISTGINPTSGAKLPTGTIDPEWQLLNYPPLDGAEANYNVDIPKSYVIKKYQNNWNEFPNAGIISSINNNRFRHNNQFASQPWRFKRNFCLCQRDKISIKGAMKADDKGILKIFDASGNEVYSKDTGTNGHRNPTAFAKSLSLPAGSYYIEFQMLNIGGVATGFSLQGAITSSKGSLRHGTSSCCNSNGFISVQKILETVNCNGKVDKGEQPGKDWRFTLKDANGNVVQTKNTDNNGELIFSNLSPGTYTVGEQPKSGWQPKSPSGGTKRVTIQANGGTSIKFFNCKSPTTGGGGTGSGGTNPRPTNFDPCCPPITKASMVNYFTPTFANGANGPFKMVFREDAAFKTMMQAYTDLLKHTCGAKGLYFTWQLCDKGTGSQPSAGYCGNAIEKEYFHFIPNGNGVIQNSAYTGTGFFNNNGAECQPNRWYRITVGVYPNDKLDCFDTKTCAKSTYFDFRWQMIGRSNARSKPVLEIKGMGSKSIHSRN